MKELIERGVNCVVLSTGFLGQLQIGSETIKMLENLNMPVYVKQTQEAVELYNQLRETKSVGALFHTTC